MMAKKKEVIDIQFDIKDFLDIATRYSIEPNSVLVENTGKGTLLGYVDFYLKKIYLKAGMSTKMKVQTLIHEMLHIIKHENNLDNSEKQNVSDEKRIYEQIYRDKAKSLE